MTPSLAVEMVVLSCKSCVLALCFFNSFSQSFLCTPHRRHPHPPFALCSHPCGMSTFLIPSPSLPHPRSLKIAALLNRLSLSFICHSPHCAPLAQTLPVFDLFSLLTPPNTHITPALHTSMHCSAVISVDMFAPYSLSYSTPKKEGGRGVIQKERTASPSSPLYVLSSLPPSCSDPGQLYLEAG